MLWEHYIYVDIGVVCRVVCIIVNLGVEEIMVIINHVTEGAINDHVIQGFVCHKV